MTIRLILWWCICLGFPFMLRAAVVSLPPIFGDHMVLQRNLPVPVWGMANPGISVQVTLGEQRASTVADKEGRWKVVLPPMKAGGPFELRIVGNETKLLLKDILIGEVWLCAGQSNMEWPLERTVSGTKAIEAADHPEIRLYKLQRQHPLTPAPFTPEEYRMISQREFLQAGHWQVCTPESVAQFSGVGYFFGRKLADSLGVPVGLIQNAVGGSPIESWTRSQRLAAHPQLAEMMGLDWMDAPGHHPWVVERARENLAPFFDGSDREVEMSHPFAPQYLFDTGVRPLAPFAIRGVLWYQGESNATHPTYYKPLFQTMVQDWRQAWQNDTLPFLFVQLPRIGNRSRWPEFREQQAACLEIDYTGMIVSIDEGHPTDVHPREKKVIGERLCGLALSKIYGFDLLAESPMLAQFEWNPEHRSLKLNFHSTGTGLRLSSGLLPTGFRIRVYRDGGREEAVIPPTRIVLKEDFVELFYPEGALPTEVLYAWAPFPENNVVNSAGLPMTPFRVELEGNN